jgi:hypothetical protein
MGYMSNEFGCDFVLVDVNFWKFSLSGGPCHKITYRVHYSYVKKCRPMCFNVFQLSFLWTIKICNYEFFISFLVHHFFLENRGLAFYFRFWY